MAVVEVHGPPAEFLAAYHERDWDRMRAAFADDCVFEEIGRPSRRVLGADKIVDVFKTWSATVPDLRGEVLSCVESDDGVALEVLWEGSPQAPFGNYASTGHGPRVQVALIFRIKDGAITEFRNYYDSLALYQVLGISG